MKQFLMKEFAVRKDGTNEWYEVKAINQIDAVKAFAYHYDRTGHKISDGGIRVEVKQLGINTISLIDLYAETVVCYHCNEVK